MTDSLSRLQVEILEALTEAPGYGLEIIRRIEEKLKAAGLLGTLLIRPIYPTLRDLEQAGYLVTDERYEVSGGMPRVYYTLTDAGRARLVAWNQRDDVASPAEASRWLEAVGDDLVFGSPDGPRTQGFAVSTEDPPDRPLRPISLELIWNGKRVAWASGTARTPEETYRYAILALESILAQMAVGVKKGVALKMDQGGDS